MSENTTIAWTNATFSPWWGCQKVSPGCDNCYAERDANRFSGGKVLWGVDSERRVFGDKHWNDPLRWNRKAEAAGRRMRVFCASMADVFDNHETAEELRPRLWALIKATPMLEWQILTKRVGNIPSRLPSDWGSGYPNVWLGISVVNQEETDRDVPKLLRIPAIIRWLSVEPQLDSVDLTGYEELSWVVCGGESGPKARRFDVAWARSLRDWCKSTGTAYFMKQMGANADTDHRTRPAGENYYWPMVLRDRAGADPAEWPQDIRIREFPR